MKSVYCAPVSRRGRSVSRNNPNRMFTIVLIASVAIVVTASTILVTVVIVIVTATMVSILILVLAVIILSVAIIVVAIILKSTISATSVAVTTTLIRVSIALARFCGLSFSVFTTCYVILYNKLRNNFLWLLKVSSCNNGFNDFVSSCSLVFLIVIS